ncbi:NAD(+) kinase [Ceratocystis fimbriata CBS 114723]|uniref:NAD(+) kinase n=1 Tax=Ceratocystis fimbriata CBS 114723 TaxID=1035309 RepID=A0A2C5X9H4_9PEZI|nr:NAD(+) kinase [Ceratocystis fimbriata CBS 114723]
MPISGAYAESCSSSVVHPALTSPLLTIDNTACSNCSYSATASNSHGNLLSNSSNHKDASQDSTSPPPQASPSASVSSPTAVAIPTASASSSSSSSLPSQEQTSSSSTSLLPAQNPSSSSSSSSPSPSPSPPTAITTAASTLASSTPNTTISTPATHSAAEKARKIPPPLRPTNLSFVARAHKPHALSLSEMLSSFTTSSFGAAAAGSGSGSGATAAISNGPISAPFPKDAAADPCSLADALNNLGMTSAGSTPSLSTAIPALRSPCFYHKRFDDAVDIDRVLEEIKGDESMSHSRLVQTATSVREISKQLQRRPIKRAVRNVMIVTKARDNQLVYLTRELAMWLMRTPRYGSDVGVNVYVDAKLRNSRRFDADGLRSMDPRFDSMLRFWSPDLCWTQPERFDLVLTLGGDGTVLFTSWLFQRIVPPTLSFSLGSLGFLTSFEYERYAAHLNRVMGDAGMKVNLRMRFTCTVFHNAGLNKPPVSEGEQFEVLNELVIDRGPSPYVSNLELYGDDELLTVVQADGCIFSTPTGSTAYSLSAGGSLVHPDIPAILLTPICPHTLSFRPMVLSDTMALRVCIPHNSRATAYCAFDGKGRVELRQGDCVTITASQYPFPTVTRTDTEWFDSVSRTLRWNTRAAAQKPFSASPISGDDEGQRKDEDPEWDIDTDSAYYASEDCSQAASPLQRQMSMLGM